MQNSSKSTPDIKDLPPAANPVVIANKSYPYNLLADDRRFEELVYSLYKMQIESVGFQGFDSISLMPGVGDKGADCTLFTGGKKTGAIQCKKYASNLNKKEFGEEISKYILNSLLEPSLIADRNNFTYFIAVSTGLVRECSDFIDDFNNLIVNEPQLPAWISKHLSKPSFQSLALGNVLPEARDILSKIKVVKIVPQDLDLLLVSSAGENVAPLFFEHRTATGGKDLEEIKDELRNYHKRILTEARLQEELTNGSTGLSIEKNIFDTLEDSHISRKETEELHRWITNDAPLDKQGLEQNICLLAGNAGMGKTVILKDLYEKLRTEEIPVLGLKADKLMSVNLADLQDKVGLSIPIIDLIEQCKQHSKKIVLLIDQIDALSQSMSSNRDYLHVFRSLVDRFTHDRSIRIIISVRIFDLHYDPSLKVYKNIETVTVNLLEHEDVAKVLSRAGVDHASLLPKLKELLRIPNNLNIFCSLAHVLEPRPSISTLQDLYDELYSLKILSIHPALRVNAKNVKKLLFRIAKQMFAEQSISVSRKRFESNIAELNYLESERLVKNDGNRIQFFHQSFYDYIFARRFVERGKEIIPYIKEQEQSLLIRSALKMILSFLRDYDPGRYLQSLEMLFDDTSILFHLKHMAFISVLFLEEPDDREKEIIAGLAKKDFHFAVLLLEHARSPLWLDIAIDSQLIFPVPPEQWAGYDPGKETSANDYRKGMAISFLSRFCNSETDKVLDYLAALRDDTITKEVFYNYVDWKNTKAIRLFEQCNFSDNEKFLHNQILKQMAKVNAPYSFEIIRQTIADEENYEGLNRNEHQLKEILKILSASIPEKLIDALEGVLLRELQTEDKQYFKIYDDHIYTGVNFSDKENLYGKEFYYWILARSLRHAAEKENPAFDAFLNRHLKSRYEAFLRLIIYAVKPDPACNAGTVYALFLHLDENSHFMTSSDLGVEFRDVFEKAFIHFNPGQQEAVSKIIFHLRNPAEAKVWSFGPKPLPHLNWGNTQLSLLQRLPTDYISSSPPLKKRYQELVRRFNTFKEEYQNKNVMAGVVRRPLSEAAYKNMGMKQWLNSFRKYNSGRDSIREDFLKGGLWEHSWAFREYCKNFPGIDKAEIIRAAIADPMIHKSYPILGLVGLSEAHYDSLIVHDIFMLCRSFMDDPENISHYTRVAQYLLRDGIEDDSLIDFVISQALDWHGKKPFSIEEGKETSIDGLVMKAINTTYGTAAESLLYIKNKKYEDLIFETIQQVLKDGPVESRAVVLYRYAYLNNLNRDRAFELFCNTLLSEGDMYVKASSIWSLQYLGNYNFERLHFVFSELVGSDLLGKTDSEWLFSILYFSYLYEKPGAESLLHSLLENNKHSRQWALREIFEHFYHSDSSPKLSGLLLLKLAGIEKNDPSEHFDLTYQSFDHLKLIDIESFLIRYIELPAFALSDRLLKYLISQCKTYALLSVSIFNLAFGRSTEDHEDSFSRNDEITRFIVGAYTALKANDDISKKTRATLLASFDALLKTYNRRSKSEQILDELL